MKKRVAHPRNECSHLWDKHKELAQKRKKENKGNYLETIIKEQKGFQEKYFGIRFDSNDMKKRTEYINNNIRNLNIELLELLDTLPYKDWKDYTKKETRWMLFKDSYKEEEWKETQYEWVDALHFLVNIGLMLDINAEKAFTLYITKVEENKNRQKNKY